MTEAMTIPAASSTGEPEPMVIRRNAVLLGVLGFGAAGVCLAYLGRAISGGSPADWLAAVALGVIALPYLRMFAGTRSPLLVADETGVRIRLGGQWRGLLWDDMVQVDVHPRDGFLRDGRVVIEAGEDEPVEAGLVGLGRAVAAANSRLYGAPMAVSFGFTASASRADVVAALTELAAGRVAVSEVGRAHVLIDDPGADSWAASSWGDFDIKPEQPDPTPEPAGGPGPTCRTVEAPRALCSHDPTGASGRDHQGVGAGAHRQPGRAGVVSAGGGRRSSARPP